MSSTNRSNARDFHISDYYVTPKDAIRKFMLEFIDNELFPTHGIGWMDKITILDPCAGGNPDREFSIELLEGEDKKKLEKELRKVADIVNFNSETNHFDCIQKAKGMSYPETLSEWGMKVMTNDLREDSPATHHKDFLSIERENFADIVITNPPFSIAREIIEKSLKVCREGGFVIMLLRLNYIGSQDRADFWTATPPHAIYADNKRMSFTPDNGTDSIEYAHFVWKKGSKPDSAKFYILK